MGLDGSVMWMKVVRVVVVEAAGVLIECVNLILAVKDFGVELLTMM